VIRLAVRVDRAHAEPVLAELLELAPAGLEERDVDARTVEYAIYGAPGELPALPDLRAAAGEALVDVSTTEVADGQDWRDFHRPIDVRGATGAVRVRAPWAAPLDGAHDVVIDPGQAFGTGAHPTTRLCLELLAGSGPLADWGAGTGVLAIAAARLGFSPVLAVDVAGIERIESNAAANGVRLAAVQLDLTHEPAPYAPTVVANLTLPLLEAVARVQERPQRLIASGVLSHQADAVAAAFGMVERERRELDGWAAVVLA
jgi:ribosomal protein L11 methyltransferase